MAKYSYWKFFLYPSLFQSIEMSQRHVHVNTIVYVSSAHRWVEGQLHKRLRGNSYLPPINV